MNPISQTLRRRFALAPAALATAAMLALSACGGGDVDVKADGTLATKNKYYTVGGTVGFSAAGTASVTLRLTALSDGSTSDVIVANNWPTATSHTFDQAFIKKDGYTIDVVGNNLCLPSRVTGQIDKADVTDANLFCTVPPLANSTADFTVFGAPAESTLTVAYSEFFGEPVFKTFTIGANGSTYSFDEKFATGTALQFGVVGNPVGYTCTAPMELRVDVIEPIVNCKPTPSAN